MTDPQQLQPQENHEDGSPDDLRQKGNFEFSQKRYDYAISLYTTALNHPRADEASKILNFCNRSACYFLTEEYELAHQDAKFAWELSKFTSVKAAYRLAKTSIQLREFQEAKTTIQQALNYLSSLNQPSAEKKSLEDLYDQVIEKSLEKPPAEEHSIKHVQRPISIREFQKGKELGFGNFSEIVIVTHKQTNERFALKIITKKQAEDLAKRQHPNVYNEIHMERRVLLEKLPPHHNIIRMYHAFSDYNSVYYLMEAHTEWSDLWSELKHPVHGEMIGCHRSQAKIWLYELIDALEHMHRYGIVHRDLKPENILLTKRGHVMVIDFGTAKDLIETDLNGPEFVGTPDFMSPEAVNGSSGLEQAKQEQARGEVGATHTADLYTFGAIAFILQTGHTPFWSPSPYLAFLKIKRGNIMRPVGIVDDDCWDLVQSLMKVNPESRLGAGAFTLREAGGKRKVEMHPNGYDVIREHPYFMPVHTERRKVLENTPIPTLRDLCYRVVAELVTQDAADLDICDAHPPGDSSSHDMLRLSSRDRSAVLHVLDRLKRLRDPRLYARFFEDDKKSRIDKVRPQTRDFVGMTQMNDDQGKPPKALMNDPYAEPIDSGPIVFVMISNPLFIKEINEVCDEATRKSYLEQLKKSISRVNKTRPKMAVAAGFIDSQCRKLLSRVSESIPMVVHDGSSFFSFWLSGVQCMAIRSVDNNEDCDQMAWIRENMELCRMSKHPLFVFVDADIRSLPLRMQKRLARGRTLALIGMAVQDDARSVEESISYHENEVIDDMSIKSTDSIEDEKDSFTSAMRSTQRNGLWTIRVEETPDVWTVSFEEIEQD